jgi:transposase
MRAKHAALIEALTGRFDDHHAELARMLLDQIDSLTSQIDKLTVRIEQLIAAIPAAAAPADHHDHHTDPGSSPTPPPATALPTLDPSIP